ncbi:MAG: TIGR01212 family radical SAM protein, partial [Bacteroidales bacterium]|nr:TIGR01212 family radical SAM protein [Bacteroidales bacterium]
MEYPWKHQRRFNAYAQYFEKIMGERVQKVTIDAGFTCPNRDGKVAQGGCTYCNNDSFNPSYNNATKTVDLQIEEGIEFHANRYRRANKFLAYFQAYSNSYASLENLKRIYSPALEKDEIVGLVIGTRPDCIDDEKLNFFADISKTHYVILEYGIESIYNKTLKRINRGHTFEQSIEAIEKTAAAGVKVGSHLIFGLPGESREEMMAEAEIVSKLPLNNIKFHQLQIIVDTAMQ